MSQPLNNPAPADPATPPATPPAAPPTTPPAPVADGNVDQLPEWARKAIEKANGEAASYRTQLRDAQAKLNDQPKDLESKVAELADKLAKAEKAALVAKVSKGLPDELIPLLKGDTEEELTAAAELLRKHIGKGNPADGTPPTNLRGGLDPTQQSDAFDVDKFVANWRAGAVPRASVSRSVAI